MKFEGEFLTESLSCCSETLYMYTLISKVKNAQLKKYLHLIKTGIFTVKSSRSLKGGINFCVIYIDNFLCNILCEVCPKESILFEAIN